MVIENQWGNFLSTGMEENPWVVVGGKRKAPDHACSTETMHAVCCVLLHLHVCGNIRRGIKGMGLGASLKSNLIFYFEP